jgi:hypothetical protein
LKSKLFIFVLSCAAHCAFGQVSIKGIVADQTESIPAATVLLLHADSSLVKGIVTDQHGEFIFQNISPGRYFISPSMMGYAKSPLISVLVNDKDVLLSPIVLNETSTELNAVEVIAEKPMFEQQIDRLVVNVQNSITSSGNTILEVLQKSPGVVVNKQTNSVALNGKSGVRIMINGKIMQLPMDVVVQMLDGMNASNVEKIELITTPPAKYDAEGNGGIIHIITKSNSDIGTNTSFGLTLGARWAETAGGNFNLNHRDKKFAYFIDYGVIRNHNLHTMKMSRQTLRGEFIKTVDDNSHRENITTQQNLSAGFEWKLNPNTLLNLGLAGYRSNWDMTAAANDRNRITSDSTVNTVTNIHESNIWQSRSAALELQKKFNSKSEANVNFDYLYYHNNNPSSYDNKLRYEEHDLNDVTKIDLGKKTPIAFLIGRADYRYHFSDAFILETGMKGVMSTLDNNVIVRRFINEVWTTDPFFTSHSILHEQVGAAYISTRAVPWKKWQVNSGLRYEYTHTAIGSPTEKNIINRKYGYFFPSLLVKKDLDTEKDVQFSYSRRITRPTYNDIAPYVFFWGPNTFSSGNTSLWPAISDAVKVGYHVKQWVASAQFTHSRKEINTYQPEVDAQSNVLTYRAQNLKYLNTLSVTNSYAAAITPWLEVQGNLTALYQLAQTTSVQNKARFNVYGVNLNLISSIKLPEDFSFEVSWIYQSKTISGISVYLPQGSLNAGIQKNLGDNGTLRLSMDDILYTNYWRIKTYSDEGNFKSAFVYDFHNQFIRLTYARNLGNNKLRSVKLKSGADEERGRVK